MKIFTVIWTYRFFIVSSIRTEFISRFARNSLGGLWLILNPLAQVAIYASVLSTVLSAKLHGIENQYAYAIYLMAGILAWNLFSEVLSRSINIFVDNGNLIKKIAFPKIALSLVLAGSSLINNFLLFIAVLLVFGTLGHLPNYSLFWLPILVLITLLFALGLGLIFGIINVFIRDISQIMGIVLQFWFWLTPVVYVPDILPAKFQFWILLNPMSSIVIAYHEVLVFGRSPEVNLLFYPISISFLSILLALFVYFKANEEMVDSL